MSGSVEGLGRLHQVAQRAIDLDRAIEFYRDALGVPLIARFDPPGLALLNLGGVRLLLEAAAPSATLYFWVEEIHAAFERLRSRRVGFVSEPQLVHRDDDGLFGPPGAEEWMAFFHDTEGNLLAIASRQERERPRPLASVSPERH